MEECSGESPSVKESDDEMMNPSVMGIRVGNMSQRGGERSSMGSDPPSADRIAGVAVEAAHDLVCPGHGVRVERWRMGIGQQRTTRHGVCINDMMKTMINRRNNAQSSESPCQDGIHSSPRR